MVRWIVQFLAKMRQTDQPSSCVEYIVLSKQSKSSITNPSLFF